MSLSFSVTSDIKDLNRALLNFEKREIPFASARALTKTSGIAKKEQKEEMKRVFKSPTAWTLNSTWVTPAKKSDGPKMWTNVRLKDDVAPGDIPAAKYLQPQIHGGDREQKRFEARLKNKGLITHSEKLVPAIKTKKNSFGNVSRANINKILSDLNAQFDSLTNQRDENKKKYFIAELGGVRGVWRRKRTRGAKNQFQKIIEERTLVGPKRLPQKKKVARKYAPKVVDNRVELIFIISDKPFQYRKRYDFVGTTAKTFRRNFRRVYAESLNIALRKKKFVIGKAA